MDITAFVEIVQIVPSLAIALLFAWFVREERKAQREAQVQDRMALITALKEERDLYSNNSRSIMNEWAERLKERDETWRGFLADQRALSNEAIGRLAEEIKDNGKLISAVQAILTSHDLNTREFISRQSAREKKGTGDTGPL